MKFKGNPSTDLGLDYHNFFEMEKDGKKVTRYVLSGHISSDKEKELSKYENVKLVRDGCQHRYAPEIKYDVLYVSEDLEDMVEKENNPTAKYLEAEESLDEIEILGRLESDLEQSSGDIKSLEKYAMVTSAMASLNDQILMYKSCIEQFPEDAALFESLVSEGEVQLGKLSSLINTRETSDNMARGLAEGEALSGEPAMESSKEGVKSDLSLEDDPRMSEFKKIVFSLVDNSDKLSAEAKKDFHDEMTFESLAEFVGFYSEEGPDPEETLSSKEKMEEVAKSYVEWLEQAYSE